MRIRAWGADTLGLPVGQVRRGAGAASGPGPALRVAGAARDPPRPGLGLRAWAAVLGRPVAAAGRSRHSSFRPRLALGRCYTRPI